MSPRATSAYSNPTRVEFAVRSSQFVLPPEQPVQKSELGVVAGGSSRECLGEIGRRREAVVHVLRHALEQHPLDVGRIVELRTRLSQRDGLAPETRQHQ